jgi:hypothetical protein
MDAATDSATDSATDMVVLATDAVVQKNVFGRKNHAPDAATDAVVQKNVSGCKNHTPDAATDAVVLATDAVVLNV